MKHHLRRIGCAPLALLLAAGFGCGTGFENVPGLPIVETEAASNVSLTTGTLHGAVNPNGGTTTTWFEWSEDPDLDTKGVRTANQAVGGGTAIIAIQEFLNALASNRLYYYRLVAENESGVAYGSRMNFTTPPPQAPDVITAAPSVITQTGCNFNGTVNPKGAGTDGWFEWWSDTSPMTVIETAHQSLGNGTTPGPLGQPVTNLTPGGTYHYRAVAENAGGKATGNDMDCTTLPLTTNPPVVTTEPATEIAPTAVTVNGTINPNGPDAFGRFEWGPTAAYGNVTAEQYVGNGLTAIPFSLGLTGLTQNTVYHYRAIGRGDGEATGQDQSFATPVGAIPSRLYLSNRISGAYKIIVIDPETNTEIASIPLTAAPAELAPSPDGRTVYAIVGSDLVVIDVLTNTVLDTIAGAGGLQDTNQVAVHPDGRKVYVAYRTSPGSAFEVRVIDATTHAVLGTITNSSFAGCFLPIGLAIHPSGNPLYAACRDTDSTKPDRFYLIDTTTNAAALGATFQREQNHAYLNAMAVRPDGSAVYLARGSTTIPLSDVEIFDGATGARVGGVPLPTNAFPRAEAVSPDGSRLYVADQGLGIHVIDTATNTRLLTLPATKSRGYDIAISPDGGRLYTSYLSSVFVNQTATNSWVTTITGSFTGGWQLTITPGHP
jgi:DNA-binding beta-propeller fold protein YncE